MEKGFYHSSVGYWQTTGTPPADILAAYPEGTIEVPLKPSGEHVWQNGAWVHAPPPPPTPEEIRASMPLLTARQFRLGLVSNGISPTQVQASIEAMPEGDKDKALIEWEYATEFRRTHPLISSIGSSLGLTEDQIDTMWNSAKDL